MATRRFDFKFHCIKDADIIQRLDAQPNKQQYIRQLIATDILADSLRDAFRIGDSHAVHDAPDPGELKEQAMIDYYNENCPAISNHDPEHTCTGCKFDDGKICRIEEGFEKHWNHERKTKLSSLYGRMLKDPFKDDVINNMMGDEQ